MLKKDEIYLTFEQWKRVGFVVRRGEKSYYRNEHGAATFSENQVSENQVSDGWGDEIPDYDPVSAQEVTY